MILMFWPSEMIEGFRLAVSWMLGSCAAVITEVEMEINVVVEMETDVVERWLEIPA